MDAYSALLKKIRDLRKKNGLTQADLAVDLNLSSDAYRKIEKGQNPLTISRLFKICETLGSSISQLIDNNDHWFKDIDFLESENEWLKREMEHLRGEIWFLREQNNKLMKMVEPGLNDLRIVNSSHSK